MAQTKQKIRKISSMANFIYVRQKGPYGNGTPILSAASLLHGEPFVFAWGDDLVLSKTPFTKRLIDNYNTNGSPVIGVQKVPKHHVDRYGIVKLRQGTREMEHVVEKPHVDKAPSQLAQFGRMVLTPEIVTILSQTKLGKGGELWVTDAIAEYIKQGGKFMVEEVQDGKWLTTGDPLNYLKAMVDYALEREDIGDDFRAHIKSLSL